MEVQVTKLSTQGFSRQRFRRVGCYGRGKLRTYANVILMGGLRRN